MNFVFNLKYILYFNQQYYLSFLISEEIKVNIMQHIEISYWFKFLLSQIDSYAVTFFTPKKV